MALPPADVERLAARILAASSRPAHVVFSLPAGTSRDGYRARYRELAKALHPDKARSKSAEEAFKVVTEAFRAATRGDGDRDPSRRAASPSARSPSAKKPFWSVPREEHAAPPPRWSARENPEARAASSEPAPGRWDANARRGASAFGGAAAAAAVARRSRAFEDVAAASFDDDELATPDEEDDPRAKITGKIANKEKRPSPGVPSLARVWLAAASPRGGAPAGSAARMTKTKTRARRSRTRSDVASRWAAAGSVGGLRAPRWTAPAPPCARAFGGLEDPSDDDRFAEDPTDGSIEEDAYPAADAALNVSSTSPRRAANAWLSGAGGAGGSFAAGGGSDGRRWGVSSLGSEPFVGAGGALGGLGGLWAAERFARAAWATRARWNGAGGGATKARTAARPTRPAAGGGGGGGGRGGASGCAARERAEGRERRGEGTTGGEEARRRRRVAAARTSRFEARTTRRGTTRRKTSDARARPHPAHQAPEEEVRAGDARVRVLREAAGERRERRSRESETRAKKKSHQTCHIFLLPSTPTTDSTNLVTSSPRSPPPRATATATARRARRWRFPLGADARGGEGDVRGGEEREPWPRLTLLTAYPNPLASPVASAWRMTAAREVG